MQDVELRETEYFGYYAGSDGRIYTSRHPAGFGIRPMSQARPLKTQSTPKGYKIVTVCFDQKRLSVSVHNLICLAFNGPKPSPEMMVRHDDGDKANNVPSNLIWGSGVENQADRKRHGTYLSGSQIKNAVLSVEQVRFIRENCVPYSQTHGSGALAKQLGVSRSTVENVIWGRTYADTH